MISHPYDADYHLRFITSIMMPSITRRAWLTPGRRYASKSVVLFDRRGAQSTPDAARAGGVGVREATRGYRVYLYSACRLGFSGLTLAVVRHNLDALFFVYL